MARVGKITIMVDESRNGHALTIRTIGKKGTVLLNVLNEKKQYPYVNSAATAQSYWIATLNEVIAQL